MDQRDFWRLIDEAREASDGDDALLAKDLEESLVALPPEEILRFAQLYDELRFRAYTRPLWDAASLINRFCSDDGFEDFRAWLISRGEQVYLRALEDPDSLAPFAAGGSLQFEAFLYAPGKAYFRRAGVELPGPPSFPELTGDECDEENLKVRFPNIARNLVNP
jgi:hypothetical protein